jgi:hypothetical protein
VRQKFIAGLAVLVAAGVFASPADAVVETKRCADWENPIGATGYDGVEDSNLSIDAIGHHTTCRIARAVGRAWLRTDGYMPKTLRTGGHNWRRIQREHDYWDGQFGATQMAPAWYWTMYYKRGTQMVHLEYDEEMAR